MKPLKPQTNTAMHTMSGPIDQLISSIVLCSELGSAISFAARLVALYFQISQIIAAKMAMQDRIDIHTKKSQIQSTWSTVTDAASGIQKSSDGGSVGSCCAG